MIWHAILIIRPAGQDQQVARGNLERGGESCYPFAPGTGDPVMFEPGNIGLINVRPDPLRELSLGEA